MSAKIGILALQGGFDLHLKMVTELGATPVLVKKRDALGGLEGLIIPGGESSVLLHLTDIPFRDEIKRRVVDGLPLLGTCAGLIFIAAHVENPMQASLALLQVTVRRNAYGRQVDSFVAKDIPMEKPDQPAIEEAVFIRAPKITAHSPEVEVLLRYDGDPILVKQRSITGATFHPELSAGGERIYQIAFPRVFSK